MVVSVLACGSAVPDALRAHAVHEVGPRPARELVDPLLEGADRLVVLGGRDVDADVAAVVLRLLRTERLELEVAVVAPTATPLTRALGLPTGRRAVERAVHGRAQPVPLVRHTGGGVVLGQARVTGPDGAVLHGEAYADDVRLFTGDVPAVQVLAGPAGVRSRVRSRWRSGPWVSSRALQLGSTGAEVVADGVLQGRPGPKWSFYRHTTDWLAVR